MGVTTILGLVLVGTVSSAAPRLGVLPLAGESITVTDLPVIDTIDDEIRVAARKYARGPLQSKAETLAHVTALKEAGLSCAVDDVDCTVKLAILADVDELLVGIVSLKPGDHALRMTIVDKAAARVVAEVAGPIPERGGARSNAVQKLVRRLLLDRPPPALKPVVAPAPAPAVAVVEPATVDPPPPAPPAATSPAEPSPAPAPPPDELHAVDSAPPSTTSPPVAAAASPGPNPLLLYGGIAVAAGAGVAVVGAAAGVVAIELFLGQPMPWDQRVLVAGGGIGLVGVAVIAALACAGGAGAAAAAFVVE